METLVYTYDAAGQKGLRRGRRECGFRGVPGRYVEEDARPRTKAEAFFSSRQEAL